MQDCTCPIQSFNSLLKRRVNEAWLVRGFQTGLPEAGGALREATVHYSVAAGTARFIEKTKQQLGIKGKFRNVHSQIPGQIMHFKSLLLLTMPILRAKWAL